MTRALIGCAITLLVAGCATNFRPLQARRGVPTQLATAEHDLEEGTFNLGDATVWVDSTEGNTLSLGVRLRNEGQSPLRLDLEDTQLELRTEDGRMIVIDEVAWVGDSDVPPGETGRGELIARLPDELEVADLLGFELVWAVENEDGMRITRSTPFRHESWNESQYYQY